MQELNLVVWPVPETFLNCDGHKRYAIGSAG